MIFYDSTWISRSSALVRRKSFLESSISPSRGSLWLCGQITFTRLSTVSHLNTSTGILVVWQHWAHKLFLLWALMLLFFQGGWQWHPMGLAWEPRQALHTCRLFFWCHGIRSCIFSCLFLLECVMVNIDCDLGDMSMGMTMRHYLDWVNWSGKIS